MRTTESTASSAMFANGNLSRELRWTSAAPSKRGGLGVVQPDPSGRATGGRREPLKSEVTDYI